MRKDEDFFAGKRPWSLIKDEVLGSYMSPYLAKVNRLGRPILLIDGYAGPGVFGDGKPGSPLIMCEAAEAFARNNYLAIFVNKDREHHSKLTEVIARGGWSHSAKTIWGDARKILEVLPETLQDQTVFLYLDPFGPTGCEFTLLEPFLRRNPKASTEIVLMMHMPIVHRLATRKQVLGGNANLPINRSYHETLTRVFGGEYWKDILWNNNIDAEEREWKLIQAYCGELGKYRPYTGYCPVRESADARIKYFIVYVSRHEDAMVLMNDIMAHAYHSHIHQQSYKGTLFESLDWRHMRGSRDLEDAIIEAVKEGPGQTRETLWKRIILKYFMRYTQSEYKQKVQEMVNAGRLVCPTKRPTKRLNDACCLFLPS